jgi:PAS domain S-box-containing protein
MSPRRDVPQPPAVQDRASGFLAVEPLSTEPWDLVMTFTDVPASRSHDATAPDDAGPPNLPDWAAHQALLDAINPAVVATDVEGRIVYVNRAAEELYGYARAQLLGGNVMDLLVEPVDQIPAGEIMETVLAGGRWRGQFRVMGADGPRIVHITDSPLFQDGEVVGVIGVAEPLSELQSAELANQVRQALESRAVIDQAKGILIGQHGCSPDEAFKLLSEASQRSNRKLREIARSLVEGTQGHKPGPPPARS